MADAGERAKPARGTLQRRQATAYLVSLAPGPQNVSCAALQIFRSIDSECTMGLAGAAIDNAEAYKRGLVTSAVLDVACSRAAISLLRA